MASFVDTNILIYAFASTASGPIDKVAIAKELVALLSERKELVLSVQVLSEFSSAAMRKSNPPLSHVQIADRVDQLCLQTVLPIDASLVFLALQRVQRSRISYWDALIVEAAIRSGATILYTEDMHHGTRYGDLEIRNPFLA